MSTQDPGTGYAYWMSPDGSAKVVYSLPLFHEIDAYVNEGYRRIPHGGVEVAGLLLGSLADGLLQLEAFRPIECQHAFGPSFVLSEPDLEQLREQIEAASSDPELDGLQVVGWFVGHTRSALRMAEREAGWFDELFPAPDAVAVLVKPEHFQPTQFGFLSRRAGDPMERDASAHAVILPLPGRASRAAEEPVRSIPAPQETVLSKANEIPPPTIDEPARQQTPARPPSGQATRVRSREHPAFPEPAVSPEPPEFQPVAPSEYPLAQSEPEISSSELSSRPSVSNPAGEQFAREQVSVPREVVPNPPAQFDLPPLRRATREVAQEKNALGWRFAAVLILAAVLGCIAGYLAYLRLPSPVIALAAHEQQSSLVISWPASQTEDVEYATIRINDGQRRVLSTEEKEAGQAVVTPPPGNVKVEVTARHWLRDARGILRLVRRTALLPGNGAAQGNVVGTSTVTPPLSQVPYR